MLPPEVDATCSGSSAGQETMDDEAVAQQLEDFRKKMGGVQRWMEQADFVFLDSELEWLQYQYVGRRHDALVNQQQNEQVIERGKMVAMEHMAKVMAATASQRDNSADNKERKVGDEDAFEQPAAKLQKLSPWPAAAAAASAPAPHMSPPATPAQTQPPPSPMPPATPSMPPTPATPATPATPMGAGRGRGKRKRNSIDPDNYAHVIRVDEGVDPPEYRCTICKRQFKNRLNIRYHIACADASAGHACKECGRVFKSSSHLTYHMRTAHDGEKPYKCRFCEKAFAQSVKLKRHERTHTGERPFR